MSKSTPSIHLEGITPILNVRDMKASRSFYVDILGFEEDDWGTDEFTSVRRDKTGIYLCKGAQGKSGTWLWVGFDGDIFQLHNYLIEKGVRIRRAPKNFSWATEMHVFDPDNHVLRFGTDPDPNKPFEDSNAASFFAE